MENFKEEILGKLYDLGLYNEIKTEDIPKLDLYMDQVISIFESGLGGLRRGEDDKILTKTMINNYTKDKLLMPAKNKKYSRNHIILMIIIYHLKQSLSINDIKLLLNGIVKSSEDTGNEGIDIEKLYEDFLYIKKSEADGFEDQMKSKLNCILERCKDKGEDKENYESLLLTVLSLINSSNMQKRMAEKLIDEYFKCRLV